MPTRCTERWNHFDTAHIPSLDQRPSTNSKTDVQTARRAVRHRRA